MTGTADDLATRIADLPARRHRLAAARRWARWWQAQPAVAGLRAALDAIEGWDEHAASRALDLAAPLLADLGWAERAVAALARLARADPLFEPPLRPVRHEGEQGLVLVEHPVLRIAAIRLPAAALHARRAAALGTRAIGFSGTSSLLRVVQAGGAAIDLWEADRADDAFSLGAARPCRPAGRLDLADGMVLRLDGACRSWSFARIVDDVLLVHAVARVGGAPFQVEYAADDGRPLAASAADGASSRQQILADMLARMGRRDALSTLATLTVEGPFDLRWAAARAAWTIDPAAARPLLYRMARADPHPEVRATARLALDAA